MGSIERKGLPLWNHAKGGPMLGPGVSRMSRSRPLQGALPPGKPAGYAVWPGGGGAWCGWPGGGER